MRSITSHNVVVEIQTSDSPQGDAPTYTNPAVDMSCLARKYSRSVSAKTLELGGITSISDELFITRYTGKVDLEIYVPTTGGLQFQNSIGYYCKVAATLVDSGAPITWVDEGIITEVSMSTDLDGILTETLTIQMGAYGASSFGGYI